MTIDERLERIAERHEALTQSVELLTHETRELGQKVKQQGENIDKVLRVATLLTSKVRDHEERISSLE